MGDDPGRREPTRCAWQQLPIKDKRHLVRSTQVEVVADHALEERAASLRAIEHACVGHLELTESQLIGVARLEVVSRKWRRQAVEPAPKEGVYGIGAEPVADPLQ